VNKVEVGKTDGEFVRFHLVHPDGCRVTFITRGSYSEGRQIRSESACKRHRMMGVSFEGDGK
jgi:hypothetical protein